LPAALDSLDYGETLASVARLAVPAYADWCFVELLMPDGRIDRVVGPFPGVTDSGIAVLGQTPW
jgi:hypothetical protein